jgi:hypothetical protein
MRRKIFFFWVKHNLFIFLYEIKKDKGKGRSIFAPPLSLNDL